MARQCSRARLEVHPDAEGKAARASGTPAVPCPAPCSPSRPPAAPSSGRPPRTWDLVQPQGTRGPRCASRTPGSPAPPGARPAHCPRGVTQKPPSPARPSFLPVRRGHSPAGGAQRGGGAAGRGSSRGRLWAIPSRPAAPWGAQEARGGGSGRSAGCLPPPPHAAPSAVASARPRGSLLPRLQSPRSAVPRPRPPPFSLFSSPLSPAKPSSPKAGSKRASRLTEATESGRTSQPGNRAEQRFGDRRLRAHRMGKSRRGGDPEMATDS